MLKMPDVLKSITRQRRGRRHPLPGAIVMSVLLGVVAACGSSTSTTSPTPVTTTSTFTGSVSQNGAVVNTFTTATAGQIIASLKAVGPDATKALGFALGSISTDLNNKQVCQVVLDAPQALQGQQLTGSASTAGTYCVRVYDSGAVTAGTPFTYTVTVSHP